MNAAARLAVLASACGLVFASTSVAVVAGFSDLVDAPAATLVRASPMRPWLAEAARDLTSLGSNLVLGLGSLIAAGYAASTGSRGVAARLLAAPIGCLLLVGIVKSLSERARPHLTPDGPLVFTSSFPSSHAALSAAVLAVFAGSQPRHEPSRWTRRLLVATAAGLSMSIGFSRLYLGLHWLTDVIAGWALGLAWGCLCLAMFRHGRRLAGPA